MLQQPLRNPPHVRAHASCSRHLCLCHSTSTKPSQTCIWLFPPRGEESASAPDCPPCAPSVPSRGGTPPASWPVSFAHCSNSHGVRLSRAPQSVPVGVPPVVHSSPLPADGVPPIMHPPLGRPASVQGQPASPAPARLARDRARRQRRKRTMRSVWREIREALRVLNCCAWPVLSLSFSLAPFVVAGCTATDASRVHRCGLCRM